MILRRYGTSYQSVEVAFDAKALHEVGFRRDRQRSIPADELDGAYEVVQTIELSETASGWVQSETEQAMLDALRARLQELDARLDDGRVIVVENGPGHDWPKPRQSMKKIVERGENRLRFDYSMAPALRLTVRRPST